MHPNVISVFHRFQRFWEKLLHRSWSGTNDLQPDQQVSSRFRSFDVHLCEKYKLTRTGTQLASCMFFSLCYFAMNRTKNGDSCLHVIVRGKVVSSSQTMQLDSIYILSLFVRVLDIVLMFVCMF